MQLIPEFKIGTFNAWIFTACYLLLSYSLMLINKEASKKLGNPPDMKLTRKEKVIGNIGNIIIYIIFLYSIFLPLKLGTAWFYVGLALCLLGVVTWTIAIVNIADIPLGEPWNKGLYRYSKHPMALSGYLILIGAGVASASWVFLLFSIVYIILSAIPTVAEERFCLGKFGTAYREYMNRTPRWLGLPKSNKL